MRESLCGSEDLEKLDFISMKRIKSPTHAVLPQAVRETTA
jgi:hypothetical protein